MAIIIKSPQEIEAMKEAGRISAKVLREVGKRDMNRLTDFLDTHYTTLPRTLLRYAIERLPVEQRKHYMARKA